MDALARARQLLAAYAGLDPPAWALRARVELRMLEAGAKSPEAYVERLANDPRELGLLCEALRVGETRFFRHRAHVAALTGLVIPDLLARRAQTRRLRAWSAGCATGEEAYTLAMLLLEALPRGFSVRVLATDLSAAALAHARTGRYSEAAVSGVPAQLAERWLARARGGGFEVRPELARVVELREHSLTGADFPRERDLILCRNVLIYFDRAARERALDRLLVSLAPGGYLLLGYAEFLRGRDGEVETVRSPDGVVYRKREPGARKGPRAAAPTAPVRTRIRTPTQPVPRDLAGATRSPPATVALDGVIGDARAATERLREVVGRPAAVLLDGAEFLADEAAAAIRRAAAAGPLVLVASRAGVLRWIGRTGLCDDVRIAPDVESAHRELAGA
ncbi:MAG TPA: protein-glutamate O-methyltransferase CheR [Polyangia bacterium]|nr:protein-glutamate O-methyltransferase CheR [Polyangia bacterium]